MNTNHTLYEKNTKKQIIYILIFLSLFSLSTGIWVTYSSLWLEANTISVNNVSYIISIASFVTFFFAVGFVFISLKINLLSVLKVAMLIKIASVVVLIFLFQSGILWLVLTLFIVDAVSTNIVVLSIYPLISKNIKSNKIYSHKKLMEYTFTDIGVIEAGFILSILLAKSYEYNVLLIASTIVSVISFVFLFKIKPVKDNKKFSFKRVYSDKIIPYYQVFNLLSKIAYATTLGSLVLVLTALLGLGVKTSALFIIVVSVSGDLFGYFAVYKLNFKNDYISFSLKFWMRCVVYGIVAIIGNITVAIVGVFISLLVLRAWENVSDGHYINRISQKTNWVFQACNSEYQNLVRQ